MRKEGGEEGAPATWMVTPNYEMSSPGNVPQANIPARFFCRESAAVVPKASWSPNAQLISLHPKYLEGLLKIGLKRSGEGRSCPSSSSNSCVTQASSLPLDRSLLTSKRGDQVEPTLRFALKMKETWWHRRNSHKNKVLFATTPPMTLSC